MPEDFLCNAYVEQRCASCTSLANPAELYLKKFSTLKNLLQCKFSKAEYLEPELLRNPFKSRAKAKLQVGGTLSNPEIGLDRKDGGRFHISPLLDCPLHTSAINPILSSIRDLISRYNLNPYSIEKRTGELKGLIILETTSGVSVRFVSRSKDIISSYEAAASDLMKHNPNVRTVSVNIQPIPHQILEGDEEILLCGDVAQKVQYEDFYLLLPPLSFVQVTPEIAKSLYRTARDWLADKNDRKILDLFCGAGGFLMSLAPLCKSGRGIEIRKESVDSANRAATEQGLSQIRFFQGDLSKLNIAEGFDTVIVNPPRRGLGKELIGSLRMINPGQILYSSCNPETLLSDIDELSYRPVKFKAFDMFPLTEHLEVLALLER